MIERLHQRLHQRLFQRPMCRVLAAVFALALAPLVALAFNEPARAEPAEPSPAPWAEPCPEGRSPALWALMDEITDWMVRSSPEWAGPDLNDERYNDRLTDDSAAAIEQRQREAHDFLARLKALDRAGFADADTLDADLLVYVFERDVAGEPFKQWQMPVNALSGPQVWLPQLGDRVPWTTHKHVDDYLARLRRVPIAVGDAMDNMRLGMAAGRVPPRVIVEPAVAQSMAQWSPEIRADPTASPFFRPFAGLPVDDPRREEAAEIIAERIVPVYTELTVFLQNEYLPACRETIAITASVDGPALYDYDLAQHTTLPLTADEIHELGLAEVARIKQEMLAVIRSTDWFAAHPFAVPDNQVKDDTLFNAFVTYLRTDKRFVFDTPDELLAAYRDLAKRMDAQMPKLFRTLPRLPYGVRPIPDFAAASAPTAYYYSGSLEAGVPGYFMANTTALDQRPSYDIVPLTLHEAVPGHHQQISIAQELTGVHPVHKLLGFTAYTKGWGLYAERLGLEVGGDSVPEPADTTGFDRSRGMYANPYDDFGRLNYEMWRALRLVVDTGIHAKGWTRQQAIDYMLANSANTAVDTANEVDRYIGWPGQATAYKVGERKIRELRARAEEALGESFDLRDFHDALLDAGSLPLPVLEAKMDRWIAEQKAR